MLAFASRVRISCFALVFGYLPSHIDTLLFIPISDSRPMGAYQYHVLNSIHVCIKQAFSQYANACL